jgi:hypothetical protein
MLKHQDSAHNHSVRKLQQFNQQNGKTQIYPGYTTLVLKIPNCEIQAFHCYLFPDLLSFLIQGWFLF